VIRALCVSFVCTAAAFAHDPITTKLLWTQEISRLIYRHCASCHHDGGAAMSLMTYEEARPWAKAIRDEVISRRMPPWGPVKGVGEFRDDPSLSQIEIDMIVNWVEGGAPEGNEIYLPPAPRSYPQPSAPRMGREWTVSTAAPITLAEAVELAGVRPARLATGESLEVTAYLPDGAVRRLIWIRGWRPQWLRTFYFRRAVRLPKGSRVKVFSGRVAEVAVSEVAIRESKK